MITLEQIITITGFFILLVLALNSFDYRHCNKGRQSKPKTDKPPIEHKPILINDYTNGHYYL